ncbi:MAG: alpha amylase N-terminal ig-like domain-containing protein [Oscillospiraceae bacterium]|nr:alpha amylase N-terminal ig-like domain-containing protein [Oscillospiraceae bacterium]
MDKWLESVYSDGTAGFVSDPHPKLFQTVKVRIRMYADAPVKHVLLRSDPNGEEHFAQMHLVGTVHGLSYYEADLRITENRMSYQFYLVCEDVVYFYTQMGITTYIRI